MTISEHTTRLAGKVAIITGGASGIGRASAELFARDGARVVIADRAAEQGESVAADLRAAGYQALFVPTDVARAADAERAVKTAMDTFGPPDILFSNAGVLRIGSFWEMSEADFDALVAVNFKGAFLMARAVLLPMIQRGRGSIIFTASNLAFQGLARFSAYCGTKGALVAMARSLALEAGPHGIRVNCICPGPILTPMQDVPLAEYADPKTVLREAAQNVPVRRLGQPADVAQLALYLASDESTFVTGAAFVIDGGASAQ
ncbi:MAG: SDR family oxidoreductase [Anaerolineae bacterium]|nr:SDR family oxidoreductase [Anaerolineae bacterium]